MAKAKKKLSLEEALEEAIVKEEDRPYEVQGNWVWTKFGNICTIENGYAFKSDDYKESGIPLIRISNIIDNQIDISNCVYIQEEHVSEKFIISQGDLLIAMSGATTGKNGVYTLELPAYLNQRVGNIKLKNEKLITQKFRNYYIMHKNQEILKKAYGGAQPNISGKLIEDLLVPLPPLAEQHRIVSVIESLFEKLDKAKELIQNALDSFESRKAAILHKAFTGELTAKWREENGVSLGSWKERELGELCTSFQYGTSKKSESDGDVVVLRMGNMQGGEFVWDNLVYTTDEEDIKKYSLKYGDVLFNRTNSPELVGKTSIYRGERPAIFAGYLIRINYKPCLNGEYLNYFLNSPRAREYCNEVKSDGVNQSNINAKKLSQFEIPYCSLQEQQEIVRILDNLLEKEQRAKEAYDVIEKIDLMKKSILARAFRGELGTNNPEEESAIELLKEVIKEKLY